MAPPPPRVLESSNPMPTKALHRTLLSCVVLISGACASGEHLNGPRPVPPPRTARTAYTRAIEETAGGTRVSSWDAAGSSALRSKIFVQPSFEETLAFPAERPLAATYRFNLTRGQRIDVRIRTESGEAPFADVFEVIDTAIFRHVYAAERGAAAFSYIATTDGMHVLRLQPPVTGGGRYEVHVTGPDVRALDFPVAGGTPASIAGQWGDPRDGGARSHKGVDIFAPRGTPVVAVANGVITAVENTAVGGRVVWQRDDERGLMYYYAHLDEQLTAEGRRVSAGDTIGRVGNTGNASGGSTHLHFGVFRDGYQAENPTPYLLATRNDEPAGSPVTTDHAPAELGHRVRVGGDRVRLRTSPSEASAVIDQLSAGTELLMIGFVNGWSRVVLGDGTTGFVASWLLERRAGE
jgi:peptidoglycan LD-endopeptidase LytH